MKLVEVVTPINRRWDGRNQDLQRMISQFMDSKMTIAEVIFEDEYKDAKACYSAWYTAIRRSNRRLRAFTSKGKVYIEKLDK